MSLLFHPKRSVLLSVLVCLSSVLAIWGPKWGASVWFAYVFVPTTMLLVLSLAISSPRPDAGRLKWAIVVGLLFSVMGDTLLMLPKDLFLWGLVAFLTAHVCYVAAFTADCRLAASIGPFLFWAAFGVVMLCVLWPNVAGGLRIPVAAYTTLIMLMAAQACARAITVKTRSAVVLAIGAVLFVVSDSLLALNRFGYSMPASRVLILVPYFSAQWTIAISLCVRERVAQP